MRLTNKIKALEVTLTKKTNKEIEFPFYSPEEKKSVAELIYEIKMVDISGYKDIEEFTRKFLDMSDQEQGLFVGCRPADIGKAVFQKMIDKWGR